MGNSKVNNLVSVEILTSTEYVSFGEWNEFVFHTNIDNIIAIIVFDKGGNYPEYTSINPNGWIRAGASKENKEQSIKVLRLKK